MEKKRRIYSLTASIIGVIVCVGVILVASLMLAGTLWFVATDIAILFALSGFIPACGLGICAAIHIPRPNRTQDGRYKSNMVSCIFMIVFAVILIVACILSMYSDTSILRKCFYPIVLVLSFSIIIIEIIVIDVNKSERKNNPPKQADKPQKEQNEAVKTLKELMHLRSLNLISEEQYNESVKKILKDIEE